MPTRPPKTAIRLATIAGALLFSACGDEIPPPIPESIAAVGSTSLQGFTGTALTEPVRVRVVGSDGDPFLGQSVSWSVTSGGGTVVSSGATTDESGIATAQWTLGPAAGSNTLTATAAGLGSVTFAATASFQALAPGVDIPIQGDIDVERVTIPPGVTVTLTGPTTIRSAGAIDIAGTLTGDCHELEIVGSGGGTFAGEVSNACVDVVLPGPGPDLTIMVDGPLEYSGEAVTTGDLFLSNSPAINPDNFDDLALGVSASVGVAGSAQATPCTLSGVFGIPVGLAMPGAAPGQPGMNGQNIRVGCNGAAVVDGALFNAGAGGAAGAADIADGGDQGPVTGSGAPGGNGGTIDHWFAGDVGFDGTVYRLNAGGPGGSVDAVAKADGQSAEARGGDGGNGGGLRVRSLGEMTVGPS